MKKLSDKELLNIAKGIIPDNSDEAQSFDIARHRSYWLEIPELPGTRKTIEARYSKRKRFRREIFTLIKRMRRSLELGNEHLAIKSILDEQLDSNLGMTWLTFTYNWDIHPKNHTKVIRREHWFSEGGSYDQFGAMEPTAFTEQEIS